MKKEQDSKVGGNLHTRYQAGGSVLRRLVQAAKKRGRIRSARALARELGFSPSGFSMMMSGELRPPISVLPDLVNRLVEETSAEQIMSRLGIGFGYAPYLVERRMTLRVAYCTYPPFVNRSTRVGQTWEGLSIDFVEHVAHALRLKVEDVSHGADLAFDEALNMLQADEADIMATVVMPTLRRKQRLNFSSPLPGMRMGTGMIAQRRVAERHSLEMMHSEGVGFQAVVIQGEIGEEYLKAFLPTRRYGRPVVLQAFDLDRIVDELREDHRIGIFDALTCHRLEECSGGVLQRLRRAAGVEGQQATHLGTYEVCFALNKRNPELATAFQAGMDAMSGEGLTVLEGLYRRYRHDLLPIFQGADIPDPFVRYRLMDAMRSETRP